MGEYYVEYDQESACWGVFHTDKRPGYCYALFTTETEAKEWVQEQMQLSAMEIEQEDLNNVYD